jgi:hypothetical protein
MIFLFQDAYPCDARCVLAIGGTGESRWSEEQTSLQATFRSLDAYLKECEKAEYGKLDPLFQLIHNDTEGGWIIPKQVFVENELLHAIFSNSPDCMPFVSNGVIPLRADDPWLEKIKIGKFQAAFVECAARCDRGLVPLMWLMSPAKTPEQQLYQALGFVLVDRPYSHYVEVASQLPFTRLVCDLFAGLLAARSVCKFRHSK